MMILKGTKERMTMMLERGRERERKRKIVPSFINLKM